MCFGQLFLSPKAAVKAHWASFWAATWAFLFSLLGLSYSIHDLMIEETLLRGQILDHVTWTIFLGRINVSDEAWKCNYHFEELQNGHRRLIGVHKGLTVFKVVIANGTFGSFDGDTINDVTIDVPTAA